MASGVNKVILVGNLGADPELRVTQVGKSVLSISLATTEQWLDQNKEVQEHTEWHRISIWGKRGEALSRILTKGKQVYIEGRLRTSSYEREGVKHWSTEITANDVVLCGDPRSGVAGRRPQTEPTPDPRDRSRGGPPDDRGSAPGANYGPGEDDIPF